MVTGLPQQLHAVPGQDQALMTRYPPYISYSDYRIAVPAVATALFGWLDMEESSPPLTAAEHSRLLFLLNAVRLSPKSTKTFVALLQYNASPTLKGYLDRLLLAGHPELEAEAIRIELL